MLVTWLHLVSFKVMVSLSIECAYVRLIIFYSNWRWLFYIKSTDLFEVAFCATVNIKLHNIEKCWLCFKWECLAFLFLSSYLVIWWSRGALCIIQIFCVIDIFKRHITAYLQVDDYRTLENVLRKNSIIALYLFLIKIFAWHQSFFI